MAERDQAVRSEAFGGGRTNARAASTQAEAVDRRNTMRMREIVARAGWPDKDVVGEDGAQAAWLLVQHADDLTFQRHCLALLERAADSGLVDPAHVAYLTDRVRMKEGRPQIYGTQLRERDGRLVPFPIEDAERVDHRRARVGMPPLAEYLRDAARFYSPVHGVRERSVGRSHERSPERS
jgi:hypothetical protein